MSHMLLVAALGEVSPSMRDSTTSYGSEDSELPGGEELVQSQLGASFIFLWAFDSYLIKALHDAVIGW